MDAPRALGATALERSPHLKTPCDLPIDHERRAHAPRRDLWCRATAPTPHCREADAQSLRYLDCRHLAEQTSIGGTQDLEPALVLCVGSLRGGAALGLVEGRLPAPQGS